MVPIEGSGGANVPYLGCVEVRMHISGINSFDRDVLMLISSTTTHYHKRVPIQVGSHIIDQVTNCISEDELQSLSQYWKVAYVSMIISKAALVGDLEFDLDQVRGKVVTCEEVKIPALQTIVVKGLTMITGHCKHVHLLMESSPICVNVFVLVNTSELRPGRSDVTVVLQNRSEKDVTLKPHTEIGTVTAANLVPSTHVSNDFDLQESPWASAVILVHKKDGKLQFCIDLQKVNARTIKVHGSACIVFNKIDETLDCLNGAEWFSSLDLKLSYW